MPKKKVKSKVQYVNWKAPYQPGSNLHKFHQAMMKKGGLSYKAFDKMIKETGASRSFIFKALRGGQSKGWTWEFIDKREHYRLVNLKKSNWYTK